MEGISSMSMDDEVFLTPSDPALPSSVCTEAEYQADGWLTVALYASKNHQKNHDICILLNTVQRNQQSTDVTTATETGKESGEALADQTGWTPVTEEGGQAARPERVAEPMRTPRPNIFPVRPSSGTSNSRAQRQPDQGTCEGGDDGPREQVEIAKSSSEFEVPLDVEPPPYVDYYVLHKMMKLVKPYNPQWTPKHMKTVVEARRRFYHAFQVWIGVINQCTDLCAYDRIMKNEIQARKEAFEKRLLQTYSIADLNNLVHAQSAGDLGFDEKEARELDTKLSANKLRIHRERRNEEEARKRRDNAARDLVLIKRALLADDMPVLVKIVDTVNNIKVRKAVRDRKENERPKAQKAEEGNKMLKEPPRPKTRARKRKIDGSVATAQVSKKNGGPKRQRKT